MKNTFFRCLILCAATISISAADPIEDSLVQARSEKSKLISEIFENESALIKYECAIHIQKAIYDLTNEKPINDSSKTKIAMMVDCISGHSAFLQCNKNNISETTEENRNCISNSKPRFIDENIKLSYTDLAESFTAISGNIIQFVSDITTVDPTKLSEIINNTTE